MVRNGDYGKIGEDEYQIFSNDDGSFDIVTRDSTSLNKGFHKDKSQPSIYFKTVKRDELDRIYRVYTKAYYKNKIVNIASERDNKVLVGTNDAAIANDLNLDRTDKYYYEKWVNKSEVETFEEKKDIKV